MCFWSLKRAQFCLLSSPLTAFYKEGGLQLPACSANSSRFPVILCSAVVLTAVFWTWQEWRRKLLLRVRKFGRDSRSFWRSTESPLSTSGPLPPTAHALQTGWGNPFLPASLPPKYFASSSTSCTPCIILHTFIMSPFGCLFSTKLKIPQSDLPYQGGCSTLLIILVSLFWTVSSCSISFLRQDHQNCKQYSKCGCTFNLENSILILTALFLIQFDLFS